MADQVVRVHFQGDAKNLVDALGTLGVQAELEADRVDKAFGDRMVKSTEKTSGAFRKLGNTIGQSSLPFSGAAFGHMADRIDTADTKGKKFNQTLSELGRVSLLAGAVGVAGLAAKALELGGNFQESMTQLVTGAGEAEKNIGMVEQGILKLSPATAESTQQLASGMYEIESAGFHGKAGLDVLKAAAQGAKTGAADLGTVANGVTTVLNDYGLGAGQAARVTSQLVATVAAGKTHMADLAGALATVTPIAATAHVSLEQVLGAMATMTANGTPAADAATYLKQTIAQLENPTAKAADEMKSLGLSSTDVSQNLGKRGLTGTLDLFTTAIEHHMGPAGVVLIEQLKKAASGSTATQKAIQKLAQDTAALGPNMTQIAQGYERGKISATDYQTALASLDPEHQKLMKSVAGLTSQIDNAGQTSVNNFDRIVNNLPPAEQTYVGALATMVGGTRSMQAALELTGTHAKVFADNVAAIGKTTADSKGNVQGFSTVQKDMNFQLDQAKNSVIAVVTQLGLKLIPIVNKFMLNIAKATTFLMAHKELLLAVAGIIGGVLAIAVAAFIINGIQRMADSIGQAGQSVMKFIKNLGLFKEAEVEGAAVSEETGGGFGPIGIIVGAVVIALVLLLTHWKMVMNEIKKIATDVWSFFKQWWPLLIGIFTGPIGIIVGLVIKFHKQIFDEIEKLWHDVANFFERLWRDVTGTVTRLWHDVVHFFENLWHDVTSTVSRLVDDVLGFVDRLFTGFISREVNGLRNIVNWFEGLPGRIWNAFGNLIGDMENFGGNLIKSLVQGITNAAGDVSGAIKGVLDHIPGASLAKKIPGIGQFFAEGGLVTKPTLGVIGEAGPELILPLNKFGVQPGGNGVQPLSTALSSLAGGGGPTAAGMTNYFYFVTNADSHQIAQDVTWELGRLVS